MYIKYKIIVPLIIAIQIAINLLRLCFVIFLIINRTEAHLEGYY